MLVTSNYNIKHSYLQHNLKFTPMKKKFLLVKSIIVTLTLTSCITTTITPNDAFVYQTNTPNSIILDDNFDKVWSSVVDFFAEKNLNIKIIEKESGLIVSERNYFPSEYVTSNKPSTNSYMAVQYNKALKKDGTGMRCSAEWNVRVTKIEQTRTKVTVNIGNPTVELLLVKGSYPNFFTGWERSELLASTTGNFEFLFFEFVRSKNNTQ